MKQEALKLALEALITITDAIYVESEQEADAVYKANDAVKAVKEALAQPAQETVAQAWDEGYQQGIQDERTSESNIGIAGFGAKVQPARQNPYVAYHGIKE